MENNYFFNPIKIFRDNLSNGKIQYGIAVGFSDGLISEAIADDLDFIWYDMEHVVMDQSSLNSHLLSCRSKQKFSIVRVGNYTPSGIKPVLDAGANGIIAAQINTFEEAVMFSDNCRYPTQGRRGANPRVPSNYRSVDDSFIELTNESIFVAVMIETVGALNAIEDIVQIKNLDSIVIGPYDLSGAIHKLGDVQNLKVEDAIKKIISTAKKYNKYVGIGMPINIEYAKKMIALGVDWVQIGADHEYLIKQLQNVKQSLNN